MNRDVIVFPGNGESHLALEIEMLLTADMHRALEAPGSRMKRRGDIAPLEPEGFGDETGLCAARVLDGDDGREILVSHFRRKAGPPCRIARLADDGEDRLAVVGDEIGAEQNLVMATGRAHIVQARNVGGGEHGEHAR